MSAKLISILSAELFLCPRNGVDYGFSFLEYAVGYRKPVESDQANSSAIWVLFYRNPDSESNLYLMSMLCS